MKLPTIPEHVEVTARICLSLILAYILTLGSFPRAVPQSQVVIIASIASAFTMVLPTMLFSIGAIVFPGMVANACVACCVATVLLAVAATGGVNAYVGAYFVAALILSGLRFTKAGPSSALLLMLVSLNTMGTSAIAEERGLGFVAGLWTEKGVDNPNAVFRNTLVGMCWIGVCISFARLIPPMRTARAAHSRRLLPKVLRDVAAFIRLTMEHHIVDDVEDDLSEEEEKDGDGDGDFADSTLKSPLLRSNATADDAEKKQQKMDDAIVKIVQDASVTLSPGLADLTALEPQLFRVFCECEPPVDLVAPLADLTVAANDLIFASLTFRAFSRAGFRELQCGGLKGVYEESADVLVKVADSLAKLTRSDAPATEGTIDEDPDGVRPFDPIRISDRVVRVEKLANNFIEGMNEGGRGTHFDTSARHIYVRYLQPWIMGGGLGLVASIWHVLVTSLSPTTWRRIFVKPYRDLPKFVWCLKFAFGFTALVCMEVYWPAFANLQLETKDEAKAARFSGWQIIAFAFSTTQTVEGTWKKSILRALGTCIGGFSAWLALGATSSPVGLGIWLTVTNTAVAYLGMPRGFKSRFGLDADMAWGPAYFAMTQSLVVLEVYWEYGERNDITLNRIVSNLVGIAMSMALALIPPGIYGNSPRECKFLLEDKKRAFSDCIKLVLDGSDVTGLERLHATSRAAFIEGFREADGNYTDSDKIKKMPLLKPNPKMKLALDHMAILGSSVLSLMRFGIVLIESEPECGERFAEGSEERCVLEAILDGLDIEDDPHKLSNYHLHQKASEGKSHARPNLLSNSLGRGRRVVPAHTTFTHLCIFICHYIMHREIKLDEIRWGFLGKRQTSEGRRTTLPDPLFQVPVCP